MSQWLQLLFLEPWGGEGGEGGVISNLNNC